MKKHSGAIKSLLLQGLSFERNDEYTLALSCYKTALCKAKRLGSPTVKINARAVHCEAMAQQLELEDI